MNSRAWSTAAAATLAVAFVAATFASLAAGHFTWGPPEIPKAQGEALRPETASPNVRNLAALRYRDRVPTAIIREPQNTWSNLVFIFAGTLIAMHDRRVFSRFLGAALIGLGFSSGLYHASLLPAWRTVDVAMMGWVVFSLGLLGFSAVWNTRANSRPLLDGRVAWQFWVSAVGSGLAIVAAIYRNDVRVSGFKPFDSMYVTVAGVAFVFLLMLGSLLIASKPPSFARIALLTGITAVGILCQLLDHPGLWLFRPDNPVQAHAAWHILMGIATALAYDTFAVMEGRPTMWRRAQ